MVYVIVKQTNPRIQYIIEVLLKHFWGIAYQIIEEAKIDETDFHDDLIINYTNGPVSGNNVINIPNEGLLENTGVNFKEPKIQWNKTPQIFWSEELDFTNYHLSYDPFSASFYLLSGYRYYQDFPLDKHGRYDEAKDFLIEKGSHQYPLVDWYAFELRDLLWQAYPNLPFSEPKYDFEFTVDIDQPWAFRQKGAWVNLGGGIRDLVFKEREQFQARINTFARKRQDPMDSFALLREKLPTDKTKFFCLVDNNGPEDARINLKNKRYQQLVKKLYQEGFQVGIHPSYNAFNDDEKLQSEKQYLESILEEKVHFSRQHFLRLRLPKTYEILLNSGIKRDYSACFYSSYGFKYGIARPFYWYNLAKEETTNLIVHPTMIMDRALQQHLQIEPEQLFDLITEFIEQIKQVGGQFVILLHNESLSEYQEWKGWQNTLIGLIDYIKKGTDNAGKTP